MLLLAGTHSYRTVLGGTITLRQLDYCQVYTPPALTPEQAEAAKAQVELAKQTAGEKALKYDMTLAATNDAYGLERMGERYRDGEGVDKDPAKAKEYFQNA